MRYGRGLLAILGIFVIVAGLVALGGVSYFLGRLSQPDKPSEAKREAPRPTASKLPAQRVEGEVIRKDANSYVVKDQSGREIKLNINPQTKVDDQPNIGDRVAAKVEPLPSEVHTKSLEVTKEAANADKSKTEAIPDVVEGEIRDIREEVFVVQDIRGQQIKLHADNHTKKDGNLSIGDHVIARLNNSAGQGYAVSILKR
jgi:exosome complex RNA-binding protein Csl4